MPRYGAGRLGRRDALGLLAALPALWTARAAAAEPLRIGMVPDAGATQVSVVQKAPLRDYLASRVGGPVDLVIPTSYNATVEGLGNNSLDIAYLGGLTYAKARARYNVVPLVQRDIDRQFHSLMIAHAGSGIHGVADLKGKNFAFGDINSTSGHLFGYLAMKQAGLDVRTDLRSFRYTGSHTATAQAVASGVADAGSLDESVLHAMVADGKIPADSVYVFYTSPPFADYVWVAREGLAPALQDKVAQAFLTLQPGTDDAVLDILRARAFVRADDAEYDTVRQVARELGLL
jgi:phosphonate transport system substrate-binding protein